MNDIKIINLGKIAYHEALARQEQCLAQVLNGDGHETIFICEHNDCITAGKNTPANDIEIAKKTGLPVYQIDRGGLLTAHNEGQLVIYPIIHIGNRRITVRRFIDSLLNSVIYTLAEYGLNANTDPEYPGVWVGHNKICAVGVRIQHRISKHGLALNVHNQLDIFNLFTPCGIQSRGVTSTDIECTSTAPSLNILGNKIGIRIVELLTQVK